MEIIKNKCSFNEHINIDASKFCKNCEIYLCNKCEVYHSKLFLNHNIIILDKENGEIIKEFYEEKNHYDKLKYFCRDHNQLCCAACIAKIKGKGDGQHSKCNICYIEEIIDEKTKKLKNNIKLLEKLSNEFSETIKNLKNIFEKINKTKKK